MVHVGVDAKFARDFERLLHDLLRGQIRVDQQRLGSRVCIRPTRSDRHDALLRLQHIAIARDDERGFQVGHGQHGFEAAQHAVGAPVLGQLDGCTRQVALVLFQLGLKALKQREGIGRGARKPCQHLAVVQLAHLPCRALDDDIAQRDLAIATNGDLHALRRLAAHAQNRGAMKHRCVVC